MTFLQLSNTLPVGINDLLKDLLDVVVVLGNFRKRSFFTLIDEAVISSILHDEVNKISSLPASSVVLWADLVLAKDLDSGSTCDSIFRGKVTVVHHIDDTKLDFGVVELVRHLGVGKLEGKWFAVGAPVRVESHDPEVVSILSNFSVKVCGTELFEFSEEGLI